MAAHLSALVAIAGLPFGHVLGPLVVYLIKGHDSEFVSAHAKASLNYQITISILGVIAMIAAIGGWFWFFFNVADRTSPRDTSGFPFLVSWMVILIAVLLVLLMSVVFIIMGTIAASEGRTYQYPFAITFLR